MNERYLGDGVYAVHDGYSITLDLRGQDSFTKISLEPSVLRSLNQFDKDIKDFHSEENKDTDEPKG